MSCNNSFFQLENALNGLTGQNVSLYLPILNSNGTNDATVPLTINNITNGFVNTSAGSFDISSIAAIQSNVMPRLTNTMPISKDCFSIIDAKLRNFISLNNPYTFTVLNNTFRGIVKSVCAGAIVIQSPPCDYFIISTRFISSVTRN